MKTLLLTTVLCTACVSTIAQGQLNFSSYVPTAGINAPIYDAVMFPEGSPASIAADLYWGPAGTTDSTLLAPLNQPANLSTGGYFLSGARTLPVPGGTTVVVQVRAWDSADGNSWLAVLNSGSPTARIGASGLFDVTVTGPPNVPANLVGLQSFNLIPIPEPSTVALAGLGMVGFLIFRRRVLR